MLAVVISVTERDHAGERQPVDSRLPLQLARYSEIILREAWSCHMDHC
jgi:hypothetical protein